jgi:hypothetical protein
MTDLSPLQHRRFARMYKQLSAESERRGRVSLFRTRQVREALVWTA